jgi:hypothetical protein
MGATVRRAATTANMVCWILCLWVRGVSTLTFELSSSKEMSKVMRQSGLRAKDTLVASQKILKWQVKRVKYCTANCQKKHWPTNKKDCKLQAAEIRDEALFKDPPAKEDCQICFLPIQQKFFSCASLPDATISSVPIYDFARANEELADHGTVNFYTCCGKSIFTG